MWARVSRSVLCGRLCTIWDLLDATPAIESSEMHDLNLFKFTLASLLFRPRCESRSNRIYLWMCTSWNLPKQKIDGLITSAYLHFAPALPLTPPLPFIGLSLALSASDERSIRESGAECRVPRATASTERAHRMCPIKVGEKIRYTKNMFYKFHCWKMHSY